MGDWNLRDDFAHPVSFRHTASGRGFYGTAGLDYAVNDRLLVGGFLDWRDFSSGSGTDKTFFSDGSSVSTGLNEVVWQQRQFGLRMTLLFP